MKVSTFNSQIECLVKSLRVELDKFKLNDKFIYDLSTNLPNMPCFSPSKLKDGINNNFINYTILECAILLKMLEFWDSKNG